VFGEIGVKNSYIRYSVIYNLIICKQL